MVGTDLGVVENGLGHLGSVEPGVQDNLGVVVSTRLAVVARGVVGFGQRTSLGLSKQFGGHLGSTDPIVHAKVDCGGKYVGGCVVGRGVTRCVVGCGHLRSFEPG